MKQKQEQKEPFPSLSPSELQRFLVEHAKVYNTKDEVELGVGFTEEVPFLDDESEPPVIRVNPAIPWAIKEESGLSETDAVRLLLDTLSHEVEHYKQTERGSMKPFIEQFPEHRELASACMNMVEDRYIDAQRLEEFEGLRRAYDIGTKYKMPDVFESLEDPENNRAVRMLAVIQITARDDIGFPDDYDFPNLFLKQYQSKVEEILDGVLEAHDFEERKEIAEKLAATTIKYAPEREDELPEDLKEKLDDLLDEIVQDLADELEEEIDELPSEMRERMEEEQEELIEEEAEEIDADPDECEAEEAQEAGESESESSSSDSGESGNQGESDDGEDSEGEADGDDEEEESDQGGNSSNSKPSPQNQDQDDDQDDEDENDGSPNRVENDNKRQVDPDKFDLDDFDENKNANLVAPGNVTAEGAEATSRMKESQEMGVEISEDVEKVLEELKEEQSPRKRKVNTRSGSEVDVRAAVRNEAGGANQKLFQKEVEENRHDDTVVGLTLDASGSMSGKRMEEGLASAAALGKATKAVDDEFVAETYWQKYDKASDEPVVNTSEITDLDEEFDMSDLDDIEVYSGTPTSLGIQSMRERLNESSAENGLMFVVTDGEPNVLKDGGDPGNNEEVLDECRDEVDEARDNELGVIGIAVGDDVPEEYMDDMFGDENWFRFDPDNLAEKILTIYRNEVR